MNDQRVVSAIMYLMAAAELSGYWLGVHKVASQLKREKSKRRMVKFARRRALRHKAISIVMHDRILHDRAIAEI